MAKDVVSHSSFELLTKILAEPFSCFVDGCFFLIPTGVITKDSSELDAISSALNDTSAFSNITIALRTFNATAPANGLVNQGKILIFSDQKLTL